MIFSHILDHQMREASVDRSERTTSQKAGRRSRLFDRAVLKDFDEVEDEDDKPESSTDQIQLFMKMVRSERMIDEGADAKQQPAEIFEIDGMPEKEKTAADRIEAAQNSGDCHKQVADDAAIVERTIAACFFRSSSFAASGRCSFNASSFSIDVSPFSHEESALHFNYIIEGHGVNRKERGDVLQWEGIIECLMYLLLFCVFRLRWFLPDATVCTVSQSDHGSFAVICLTIAAGSVLLLSSSVVVD